MDRFLINGGKPLNGSVKISGAKNAVLPLMAATIIVPGIYRINRVPNLKDTRTMVKLLEIIGCEIEYKETQLIIDSTKCNNPEAPYDLVKTMRASFYVLGPLLARFGYAKVSMPGGCAWGPRPINFHLDAMRIIGAEIELEDGYIIAKGEKLSGGDINFKVSSVGATGNALMAAVGTSGKTKISNAATEPEIVCLCRFLKKMGLKLSGIGTNILEIEGSEKMRPANFDIIPDRIEAATFLIAGAMVGNSVTVNDVCPEHLNSVLNKLHEVGNNLIVEKDQISIQKVGRPKPSNMVTGIYPDFPTDVQAQWMAYMSIGDGESSITDTVYADRFTHISELNRLGSEINLSQNIAKITGKPVLKGARVMSTDIRASASLIIAGLAAEGKTEISRVYHIDRGYENIEEKFQSIGAEIIRQKE
ncbi:MAG: UDP-N-acetylglucosamine 1-carboxyvinyltransferase [Candidatus Marinimicrobia bacterium]|nr:UDP-N-acetylglucosamine 1-carboxyvinyltransferase [Candidatus Neomarinimicrobiota bacterium]|tara:strand:- start:13564 stop:14817 length:1254 start_codon:yes stop_codon:yes gene_type:complete